MGDTHHIKESAVWTIIKSGNIIKSRLGYADTRELREKEAEEKRDSTQLHYTAAVCQRQ